MVGRGTSIVSGTLHASLGSEFATFELSVRLPVACGCALVSLVCTQTMHDDFNNMYMYMYMYNVHVHVYILYG